MPAHSYYKLAVRSLTFVNENHTGAREEGQQRHTWNIVNVPIAIDDVILMAYMPERSTPKLELAFKVAL